MTKRAMASVVLIVTGRMMTSRIAVLVVALVAVASGGCHLTTSNQEPDKVFVVNDTDRTLRVTTANGSDIELLPDSKRGTLPIRGCDQIDAKAKWPDGSVVDTLDQEACDEQTWTISGIGDSTLE